MSNPWQTMTRAQARAYDTRKDRFDVRVKQEALWGVIERWLPEDAKAEVLELGGGTGVWALRVAATGRRVRLTDLEQAPLARAREKIARAGLEGRIRTEQVDLCDLGRYADGAFPLILALGDPLSYCEDAERALVEMHRVLAPGGVLIADVENRYWSASFARRARSFDEAKRILLDGVAYWPDHTPPLRIREFTPAELRELLVHTGWEPLEMYPSDLVVGLLSDGALREVSGRPDGLSELIALECRLREDPSLLGSGTELQLVARRAGD